MNAPLIVFGEDWGRHPSSTQHIVRQLAADRRVMWVNSIGMRRPRFDRRDLVRISQKLGLIRTAPKAPSRRPADREVTPLGMVQLAPRAISWPGSRVANAMNRYMLSRQIEAAINAQEFERPILWTSLPTAEPVVGSLGERAVVYYCGDDFGSLVGVDHEPVRAMERRLVERADLVIAASDVLAARFPSSKTIHVPHGADIALFETPATRASDLPVGRPVAGFYGSLSDWIDVEMIAAAADELPDWVFFLIGAIETDVSVLASRSNVILAGKREHAELPGYSQHWTVSLLPFRDTPQIRACNPLKLREYLAAGRPVVSTAFPAVVRFRSVVDVATATADFIRCIKSTATLNLASVSASAAKRRDSVRGDTWSARADQVARALAAL